MMILISGAGIAGLTLGLTLHQLGMPFQIFERAETMQPVGVGINIQPNAVRELYALGFENQLDEIGVKTRDYGFYTKTGKEIWTEQRGTWAGYNWPQYSIHRGKLQMMLYDTLVDRVGPNAVVSNHKAVGFHQSDDHVELLLEAGNSQTKQIVMAFIRQFASKWFLTKGIRCGVEQCFGVAPQKRISFCLAHQWYWRAMTLSASLHIRSASPMKMGYQPSTGLRNSHVIQLKAGAKRIGTARQIPMSFFRNLRAGIFTG
jgi:hypothetical protein